MYDQTRYALEFFFSNNVPFWNMSNANERISGDNWCLADSKGDFVVVYLKNGGSAKIDLTYGGAGDSYLVRWSDPRNGGPLVFGSTLLVPATKAQSLGEAPKDGELDWVVLLSKCQGCNSSADGGGGGQDAAVIGLAVALAAVLLVIAILLFLHRRKKHEEKSNASAASASAASGATAQEQSRLSSDAVAIAVRPDPAPTPDRTTSPDVKTSEPAYQTARALPTYKDQVRSSKDQANSQNSDRRPDPCTSTDDVPAMPMLTVQGPEQDGSTVSLKEQYEALQQRMSELEALLIEKSRKESFTAAVPQSVASMKASTAHSFIAGQTVDL